MNLIFIHRITGFHQLPRAVARMTPLTRGHQQQKAMLHSNLTSGANDSVWTHRLPYAKLPQFAPLGGDTKARVCVIGSGIAGTSIAYELVTRGHDVLMLEARAAVSGESGRTSGHLSNALDDHYTEIKKKHGEKGARVAAESHTWALNRVGEVAAKLGIECDYHYVPGYEISQHDRNTNAREHGKDMSYLKHEAELAAGLGVEAAFRDDLAIRGWEGKQHDQRGGAVFKNQASFHPTLYLAGVLDWLKQQPNFRCHTHTRVLSVDESGDEVKIQTEAGHTVVCGDAVEATCVPLQKLSVIVEMSFHRTYCVAIRVPRGSVEDCFIYDSAEEYKYVRLTPCDDSDDYVIVGGCDHKVAQEGPDGRYEELEAWVRERFPQAGAVDYRWSGQIFEPFDYMGFIGRNQGRSHVYVVTGDSGNGLTHGVLAGKLIPDLIEGKENSWEHTYSPSRAASMIKSAGDMLSSDINVNMQYKRLLTSDITDIEDLVPGSGGVMTSGLSKVAVYKGEDGSVRQMSAICPHMKGVVCWNPTEKSFDCPVHGSRFDDQGNCVMGPAKAGLSPIESK